jgi:hypothetical protein
VSSLREALAQDPVTVAVPLNVLPQSEGLRLKEDPSIRSVTIKQSFIWTSIVLAVVLFFSVMSLLLMDSGAEKDTILYAKFLRVDEIR